MPVKARDITVHCNSPENWSMEMIRNYQMIYKMMTSESLLRWSSSALFSFGNGGRGTGTRFLGREGGGWWSHKTCYAFPSAVTGSKEREECWESKEIWLAFRGVVALSGVPDCLGVVACLDPEAREDRPVILPSSPPMFEVELRVLLPVSPSGSMLRKVTGRFPSIPKGWLPIRLVLPSL